RELPRRPGGRLSGVPDSIVGNPPAPPGGGWGPGRTPRPPPAQEPEMTPPGARPVRAPRGTALTARSWQTEAPLRMLMNNLDPEVAERPDDLVVYGGTG